VLLSTASRQTEIGKLDVTASVEEDIVRLDVTGRASADSCNVSVLVATGARSPTYGQLLSP
jgi:hypothetical protein